MRPSKQRAVGDIVGEARELSLDATSSPGHAAQVHRRPQHPLHVASGASSNRARSRRRARGAAPPNCARASRAGEAARASRRRARRCTRSFVCAPRDAAPAGAMKHGRGRSRFVMVTPVIASAFILIIPPVTDLCAGSYDCRRARHHGKYAQFRALEGARRKGCCGRQAGSLATGSCEESWRRSTRLPDAEAPICGGSPQARAATTELGSALCAAVMNTRSREALRGKKPTASSKSAPPNASPRCRRGRVRPLARPAALRPSRWGVVSWAGAARGRSPSAEKQRPTTTVGARAFYERRGFAPTTSWRSR